MALITALEVIVALPRSGRIAPDPFSGPTVVARIGSATFRKSLCSQALGQSAIRAPSPGFPSAEGFDTQQSAVGDRWRSAARWRPRSPGSGCAAARHGSAGLGRPVASQQCAVGQRSVFEAERLFQRLIVVAVGRQQVQQVAAVDQALFRRNARRAGCAARDTSGLTPRAASNARMAALDARLMVRCSSCLAATSRSSAGTQRFINSTAKATPSG